MSYYSRLLQLFATFLPIYGIIITAIAVYLFKSTRGKLAVLAVGPLLTLFLCMQLGEFIGRDGNLLFAVIFGFFFVGLWIYYPLLLVTWLVRLVRTRK